MKVWRITTKHAQLTDVTTPHSNTIRVISAMTLTSDATNIEYTGLDLDSVKNYFLTMNVTNGNASSQPLMHIYFNDDTTDTNYYTQSVFASSTSVSSDRYNASYLNVSGIRVGMSGMFFAKIGRVAKPFVVCESALNSGTYLQFNDTRVVWQTGNNVTKITLHSDQVNGFGSGSKLVLYEYT